MRIHRDDQDRTSARNAGGTRKLPNSAQEPEDPDYGNRGKYSASQSIALASRRNIGKPDHEDFEMTK